MKAILLFGVALVAIVVFAVIVTKCNGSRTWSLAEWKYNAGETIVWRDDAADLGTITKTGQAVVSRPPRLHRWSVVATTQRIIMAEKDINGDPLVKYVLYPGTAPGSDSKRADGGLLSTGYETILITPGVSVPHLDEHPYVMLKPVPDEPSSVNLVELRIYTDLAKTFRLP